MGKETIAPQEINEQELFLAAHGWEKTVRVALPGDFSARHYVRLSDASRKALLMVMPKPQELVPFLLMQDALRAGGMRVPAIYAVDKQHGFAIIEDLGENDFGAIIRKSAQLEHLYSVAVDALLHLHASPVPKAEYLTHFTPQLFLEQVRLFLDAYGAYVLKHSFSPQAIAAFENAWRGALEKACAIPNAVMLRDYHAANIMYLEYETGHKKAAAIDFQDGGIGPISYDIASLLEDARLDVSPVLRAHMLKTYLNASTFADKAAFMSSYHILACQRHMRILGILAKRWVSLDIPATGDFFKRTWGLLMLHHSEPALAPVYQWLDEYVPHSFREHWKP